MQSVLSKKNGAGLVWKKLFESGEIEQRPHPRVGTRLTSIYSARSSLSTAFPVTPSQLFLILGRGKYPYRSLFFS